MIRELKVGTDLKKEKKNKSRHWWVIEKSWSNLSLGTINKNN